MKWSCFLVPVTAFTLLSFYPSAARAFDVPTFDPGNDAPMPAAEVQLFTDLAAIPTGSTATDAQHQALVADLDALAVGIFTPDPAAVDQLATDLGTAATNGLFSDNVLEYLADDFIGDPDTPESWLDDIQADVASLINPSSDIYETLGPVTGVPVETGAIPLGGAYGGRINGSFDRFAVQLSAQGLQSGLLENYSGRVQLTASHFLGIGPLPTLTLDTAGLPPGNPYTVSITRRSDGASVVLGKFCVHGDSFRLAAPSGQIVALSSLASPAAEIATVSHTTFGGFSTKKPLPADYDAADVATLTVTDAQGVVRLSGNVAGGQRTSELRTLRLQLGTSGTENVVVPGAEVAVRHHAASVKTTDRFRLLARHLPVNATVTLLADGVVVDHYTTTAHGRLFIVEGFTPRKLDHAGKSLPFNTLRPGLDLSGVQSLVLIDAQATLLLYGSVDAD